MAMNVLFLHPNFPGQFKNIAQHLAHAGHRVKFICQTHYNRQIPGVERICLKGFAGHDELINKTKDENSRSNMRASQYLHGMNEAKKRGWEPNVVISHSGWGCGVYTKLVWPAAKHICYSEWWFKEDSEIFHYTPNNHHLGMKKSKAHKYFSRNQTMSLELVNSDAIVAPTHWQCQQLPKLLQKNTSIIHDGIDCDFYRPRNLGESLAPKPLLTYGTRGMEPMRCFPEFVNEIPTLMSKYDDLHIEIAGEDTINYGGKPPLDQRSWGRYAKKLLSEWIDSDRIKFVGRLTKNKYQDWLSRSWIHVYLTQPYVASWSLLESMASGCNIIANSVATNTEFCTKENSLLLASIQPGFLVEPVGQCLELNLKTLRRREAARATAERYSHTKTNEAWVAVIDRVLST
ncbi:glycosyltransferase [Synechococcus sp. MU1611]|uniref:glycosyltransferase n=1 Tax=Synechococcus sp. MU1611 TaxID=2508345 RepID=UPI001CF87835|nr:glycosyltransferase [Synechococcus sp. MU1611]MCB4411501.1 glycosyltransferase [Synechococcus sp. MU1611]